MSEDDRARGGLLRPKSGVVPGETHTAPSRGALLTPRSAPPSAPSPHPVSPSSGPGGDVLVPRSGATSMGAGPPAQEGIRLSKGAVREAISSADDPPSTGSLAIDPELIQKTLRRLRRDVGTLLELLFEEQSAAELLRQPPDPRRFEERLRESESHLHEADRDGGDRFSGKEVKAARSRFEGLRAEVRKAGGGERDGALAQLQFRQRSLLVAEIARHPAPGTLTLYASDVLKVERVGQQLGFTPAEVHNIAAMEGYAVLTTEARQWVPFEMLPGSPSTLAGVALELMQHQAEALRALRQRAVSRWLHSNGDAELADRVTEAEACSHEPGKEALALHIAAWRLGGRDLWLDARPVPSPEELGRRWGRGEVEDRMLVHCARSQVLAAWFKMLGERVLEARANALGVRPNDAVVLQQLRWALGVPWSIAGEAFTDVRTLADRVRMSSAVAQAALRAAADGTLASWLESLPAGRGDPTWQMALTDPLLKTQGTACGFWVGVYRNAQDQSLMLAREGSFETLTSSHMLLRTGFAARYWDSLKPLRTSGELMAFLLLDPALPTGLQAMPRINPGEPIDASLNALLWSLGATGMVMEWGVNDQPVQVPEDLAVLYEDDPARFEEELAKGYPLAWLGARVGQAPGWSTALAVVRDQMMGRAPAGHSGAAVAIIARRGGRCRVTRASPLR